MRTIRPTIFSTIAIALLFGFAASRNSVRAQSDAEWETLRPDREEFKIEIPKDSKFEESEEPYHRMTLNTRLYLSATEHGPVMAIVSLSGIKSNPQMYTEAQRVNSYVDAFKSFLAPKLRGKDAVARLTLVGDKTLNGNAGREYKIVISDLSGTARVFTTRKRFYAAVILNTKKDDELTDRFLSSFFLPEKIVQPPSVAAGGPALTTDNSPYPVAVRPGDGSKSDGTVAAATSNSAPNAQPDQNNATDAKPDDSAATATTKPGEHAPISGGVLNGKALSLPQPAYPAIARQANASGTVVVQVLVDESGNVISARAISGHPLLQAACVAAAQQAKFSPTSLMGDPVKVSGVLTYNFAPR